MLRMCVYTQFIYLFHLVLIFFFRPPKEMQMCLGLLRCKALILFCFKSAVKSTANSTVIVIHCIYVKH